MFKFSWWIQKRCHKKYKSINWQKKYFFNTKYNSLESTQSWNRSTMSLTTLNIYATKHWEKPMFTRPKCHGMKTRSIRYMTSFKLSALSLLGGGDIDGNVYTNDQTQAIPIIRWMQTETYTNLTIIMGINIHLYASPSQIYWFSVTALFLSAQKYPNHLQYVCIHTHNTEVSACTLIYKLASVFRFWENPTDFILHTPLLHVLWKYKRTAKLTWSQKENLFVSLCADRHTFSLSIFLLTSQTQTRIKWTVTHLMWIQCAVFIISLWLLYVFCVQQHLALIYHVALYPISHFS